MIVLKRKSSDTDIGIGDTVNYSTSAKPKFGKVFGIRAVDHAVYLAVTASL